MIKILLFSFITTLDVFPWASNPKPYQIEGLRHIHIPIWDIPEFIRGTLYQYISHRKQTCNSWWIDLHTCNITKLCYSDDLFNFSKQNKYQNCLIRFRHDPCRSSQQELMWLLITFCI